MIILRTETTEGTGISLQPASRTSKRSLRRHKGFRRGSLRKIYFAEFKNKREEIEYHAAWERFVTRELERKK